MSAVGNSVDSVDNRPRLTAELRAEIRRRIDARRRELEEVRVCPRGYANNNGYSRGCRCDLCRAAATEVRRAYRQAHREAENARQNEWRLRTGRTKTRRT